jgi:hypothetical protein
MLTNAYCYLFEQQRKNQRMLYCSIKKKNMRNGGEYVHVVLNYLSRSLVLKGVGSVRNNISLLPP